MMSGEHGNEIVVERTDDLELPAGDAYRPCVG